MNILRKISLVLSIIFLAATILLTLMCSFFSYHIIVGSLGTGQLLAALPALTVFFFGLYILSRRMGKSIYVKFSFAFLVIAVAILLLLGFSSKYRYTTHVSEDALHTVVVEEKSNVTQTSVQFYKKVFGVVYEPIYYVKFTKEQKDQYLFGDYTLTFDDQYTSITVPLFSSTEFLLPHSK